MTRLTVVLLLAPLLPPTSLAAQSGTSGELVAFVDERFHAYAPDAENLERVVEGMEQARERFVHYFSEPPLPVAVVIYRDEAQRRAHSEEALGIPTYSLRQSSSGQTGFTSWAEAGTILIRSHRQLPVVAALGPSHDPDVVDLRQGDELLAVNGTRLESFQEFLNRRRSWEPGSVVEITVRRDGTTVTLPLEFTGLEVGSAGDAATYRDAYRFQQTLPPPLVDVSLVAHEAAHTMLRAHLGTGLGASWFHEGFASRSEPGSNREGDIRALVPRVDSLLPWKRLFAMDHPAADELRGVPADGERRSGGVVVIDRGPEVFFYQQSASVLAFLEERSGPETVAKLARWLAAGRPAGEFPVPDAGKETMRLGALEEEWRGWLRSHPSSDGERSGAPPARRR